MMNSIKFLLCYLIIGFTNLSSFALVQNVSGTNDRPVWHNVNANYIFMRRNSPVGTHVFTFNATDKQTAVLTYAILGVEYFPNETGLPIRSYNSSWDINSTTRSKTNVTNCEHAESLPFPRNLFCIEYLNNTIATTGLFMKRQLQLSSLFIIDVLVADNGKPALNVTGKIYVRMARNCSSQTAFLNKVPGECTKDVKMVQLTLANSFTTSNVRLAKLSINFYSFNTFNHIGKMMTVKITDSRTKIIMKQLQQRLLIDPTREPVLFVDLLPSPIFNGTYIISVGSEGSNLTNIRGADFSGFHVFTYPVEKNCSYGICREHYSSLREILRRENSLECIKQEARVLFDAKYASCLVAFQPSNNYIWRRRNLANGSLLLPTPIKAVGNDAVLYSIVAVTYWQNDSSAAVIAMNNQWAINSKSAALSACSTSEKYKFPRNLFCIDLNGTLKSTSLFRNSLYPLSAVKVDVLASNILKMTDNATLPIILRMQLASSDCEVVSSKLASFRTQCNQGASNEIFLDKQPNNFFQFIAPANKSLLVQIGIKPNILGSLPAGGSVTYTFARSAGKSSQISRIIFEPPQTRKPYDFVNASLYRDPLVLEPLERIVITISASSPLSYIESAAQMLIVTVPYRDYCLTSCFGSYLNAMTFGGKIASRFYCSPDTLFSDAKYGRCFANSPPSLVASNISIKSAAAGSKIGSLSATDKSSSSFTYGIIAVHSKILNVNRTMPKFLSPQGPCSLVVKQLAPLNYLCVSQSTGDISITQSFNQTPGEVLTVTSFVIDSGSPKRYSVGTFTISIKDPCEKTKNLYKNLTSSRCFSGSSQTLKPITAYSATLYFSISWVNWDKVVFLKIFPTLLNVPADTLHVIFTLRVIKSQKHLQYGKQMDIVLLNSDFKKTEVKLKIDMQIYGAAQLQLSATAIKKIVATTTPSATTKSRVTETTAAPTTTNSYVTPLPNNTYNSSSVSNTSLENATQSPIRVPLRKRRQAVTLSFSTQNVSMSLNSSAFQVYGQIFKDFCGNLQCVRLFDSWKTEAQKTGLKACEEDREGVKHYFKNCSDWPNFVNHPMNQSPKLNTPVSLACSYQNFTGVTFHWLKDGKIFIQPPVYFDGRIIRAAPTSVRTKLQVLQLAGNDPGMQGYYSCYVKDALNHVVTSRSSLLRFNDVSTSKMHIKLRQAFNNNLRNTSSAEYKKLVQDVTSTLNKEFDRKGMPATRKIVFSNVRSGSVLIDANVYFMNLNATTRQAVCNGLKNFSSSSNLEVTVATYDCCYESQTGEEKIKGAISWLPVIADSYGTRRCPYSSINANVTLHQNATRKCMSNFTHGAQWMPPNITACPYKSKTTQKLEEISKTPVSAANAEALSSELDSATSSADKITNRLDIKFTADSIENLVNSKQKLAEITNNLVNTTSNIMDVQRTIIASAQRNYKSNSRMLISLENLAKDVPIAGNKTLVAARKNVALAVKPVTSQLNDGILIKATRESKLGYNNLSITETGLYSENVKNNPASIYLSTGIFQKVQMLRPGADQRIFSFVFENDKLFLSSSTLYENNTRKKNKTINSRILSASVGNLKLRNLTYEEELKGFFKPLLQDRGNTDCVFWDFLAGGGFGAWSSNGCRSDGMQDNLHRCRCNHLTNFAILLDVTGQGVPSDVAKALSIVTYIGCGISLLCLVITFLTFVIFKKLRTPLPPRILICLTFALIVTLIIFLSGIAAKDLKSCQAVGLLLHYFVLASFCWMAVEGFNLYLSFVKIVNSKIHLFILKSSIFAWGLPALIVIITAGVTKLGAYGKKNGDEWLCMITGTPFYVAYLTPILIIVVANLVVLVYVLKSLRKSSQLSKDKRMTGLTQIRIAAACSVLMGTTWIIGLFAIDVLTVPMQALFCVFNSLQGLFIFLFYCVRNNDVRKHWQNAFKVGRKEDSKTSSGQDYYRKGYSRDRAGVENKAYSNQSRKANLVEQPANELPLTSFKSTTLTSLQSSSEDDRKAMLIVSKHVEENSDDSNSSHSEAGWKQKSYTEDSAEISLGFESVQLTIKPDISKTDESPFYTVADADVCHS